MKSHHILPGSVQALVGQLKRTSKVSKDLRARAEKEMCSGRQTAQGDPSVTQTRGNSRFLPFTDPDLDRVREKDWDQWQIHFKDLFCGPFQR